MIYTNISLRHHSSLPFLLPVEMYDVLVFRLHALPPTVPVPGLLLLARRVRIAVVGVHHRRRGQKVVDRSVRPIPAHGLRRRTRLRLRGRG